MLKTITKQITNILAKSSNSLRIRCDRVFVSSMMNSSYTLVTRFDVVIVYNEERGEHWVKRVIGVPGDTVESKDDVLKINFFLLADFFDTSSFSRTTA